MEKKGRTEIEVIIAVVLGLFILVLVGVGLWLSSGSSKNFIDIFPDYGENKQEVFSVPDSVWQRSQELECVLTGRIEGGTFYELYSNYEEERYVFLNPDGIYVHGDKVGEITGENIVIHEELIPEDLNEEDKAFLKTMLNAVLIENSYVCSQEAFEKIDPVVAPTDNSELGVVLSCSDCGKGLAFCNEKKCLEISNSLKNKSCVFVDGTFYNSCEEYVSKTLIESDYSFAAEKLGVDVATIKAVSEIESSGSGFQKDGRPKILFEGHIFWGELKNAGVSEQKLEELRNQYGDILYPQWSDRGNAYSLNQYDRLEKAKSLSRELTGSESAALSSASWGKFQILGRNFKSAGSESVEEFVSLQNQNEREQLISFVNFIQNNNLAPYLRNKDWEGFARRYNGSGYKENEYDSKLSEAYEKYSGEFA